MVRRPVLAANALYSAVGSSKCLCNYAACICTSVREPTPPDCLRNERRGVTGVTAGRGGEMVVKLPRLMLSRSFLLDRRRLSAGRYGGANGKRSTANAQ